ncbi:hypothetical protein ACQY0O_004638 [Thecaphora frezii]
MALPSAPAASLSLSLSTSWPPHPSPSSIGPLYIAHFATTHSTFRIPDFCSAAAYLGIAYAFVPVPVSLNYPSATASSDHTASWRPDATRPFQLVHLSSDSAAQQLLQRCVSLRSIWAYWAHGSTYSQLHDLARSDPHRPLWEPYAKAENVPSWKAHVFSYSGTISDRRKVEVIQSFAYMDFQGRIQLKEPSMRWGVMEEYLGQELWPAGFQPSAATNRADKSTAQDDEKQALPQQGKEKGHHLLQDPAASGDDDPRLVQIFAGRRIDLRAESLVPALSKPSSSGTTAYRKSNDAALEGQSGLARDLIDKLDLKKRVYIGNTSMESEMSLLQASLVLAGPGKLVYDPFAGTGSLLYAAAVFGAMTMGSDIDGRTMRGKVNAANKADPKRAGSIGIVKSAQQYGVRDRILDCLVCDMSRAPFRTSLFTGGGGDEGGFLDGIVADPPYGVRAGAKRLGKRDPGKQRSAPFWMPDGLGPGKGCWSHERDDYIPPTRPYHLQDLIDDLLDYAFNLLKPHGRLAFWLPDMIDANDADDNGADGEEVGNGEKVPVELPRHSRRRGEGRMRLVHHSIQDFGKWGRRLITMEKIPPHEDEDEEEEQQQQERVRELEKGVRTLRTDEKGVYRADADPEEFRNRYFGSRAEKAAVGRK